MNSKATFKQQLQRNAVALISLAIAVSSLGYNTWRNEASEHNRNQRVVAIEFLRMLGDLQRLSYDLRYGDEEKTGAIGREAWSIVLTLRDMSGVADGDVPSSAQRMYEVWNADYNTLRKSSASDTDRDAARDRIIAALEALRGDAKDVLSNLD
jgi:hypothetical protein